MTILMPPASLAGKIQRGLGSGFLEALDQPRADVEAIVVACIADDPRINAQDEDRDLYYARLMLELGIDESPVGGILERNRDPDGRSTVEWLPLGVLGLLARAGRSGAVEPLRHYVASGAWWGEAVRHLSKTGDPSATDGLDTVLASRFANDVEGVVWDAGPWNEEPWRSWRETGPLAAVLAGALSSPRPEPAVELESLDAEDLLARVAFHGRRADPATEALVGRILAGSSADRRVVEEALLGSDREQAAHAVRVLGVLGDPAIIPVGDRILEAIGGGFAVPGSRLRPLILRGFEGLPAQDALVVARRWRDAMDYRFTVAMNLLELHATADDVSWTVESIRRAAARGDEIGPWARILHRFPGTGPFDGFESIYRTYVPTCCRRDLLVGMSVADPTFGDSLAMECLDDCESRAREAAAATVSLTPAAERRLRLLAEDPLEEDEVRAAASARLN